MTRRLMVTGGGGFVAGSVIAQAGAEWDVHAFARTAVQFERPGLAWRAFDLCELARLREEIAAVRPHAVIHAAARADIDWCQRNPEVAEAVNVGVTREIAAQCAAVGARMVLLSTDTVFDGERGMYTEADAPRAINHYAHTKIAAERAVLEALPGGVVARLSLVMGLPVIGSGNSFLARMIASWRAGEPVGVPDNEIRTPVDVVTLGRALLELAGADLAGIVHLAGNERMTRHAMACRIAARAGYPENLVFVKNAEASPDRAPRPVDTSLDNSRARANLQTPMLGLDEAVDLVLSGTKGTG